MIVRPVGAVYHDAQGVQSHVVVRTSSSIPTLVIQKIQAPPKSGIKFKKLMMAATFTHHEIQQSLRSFFSSLPLSLSHKISLSKFYEWGEM
ncbi:hypothetical protein AVEN_96267-1 [Araneus ventricosus]|uniref:Uncharacterized protein n=1 Tax=Araneus ventricosus TaxID=182803 RepID=A0A4Y2H508_ARAVE|nr:hypothetical protein AVEN_96267-1 [Araneus ventricosus]